MGATNKFIIAYITLCFIFVVAIAVILVTAHFYNRIDYMKTEIVVLEEKVEDLKSRLDFQDYVYTLGQEDIHSVPVNVNKKSKKFN